MNSERTEKLVQEFDGLGIDGFAILPPAPSHGRIPNAFYLTGFSGSTAILIISRDRRLFLTDSRYTEMVGDSVAGYEVVDNTAKPFFKHFKELNKDLGITKLGVEAQLLPVATFKKFAAEFAPVEIVPVENLVEKFRMQKDESEIALVRGSIRINEECFKAVVAGIKNGTTEREIAAEFEYELRKRGALEASFSPIIASGPNSSMPHAGFTDRKLVAGDPLTIDIGVVYGGYCSDMTRTVFYKDCSGIWKQRYEAVLGSKRAAEAYVRAGMTGAEVDKVAREAIARSGFSEHCFAHGLGHGVGLQIHENPRFAQGFEEPVPDRALMTVEPGIYVAGEGGIRIEDMVIVTESGCENLNNLTTELTVIG